MSFGDNFGHLLKVAKYALVLFIVTAIINFLTPLTTSLAGLLDRLAPPPQAEVISTRAVISSLRGIGKLVTITSDPHHREIQVSVSSGFLNLGAFSANHEAEGIIEAGIDFTRIRTSSLQCGETCTLILPHPSITNCSILRLRQKDQSLSLLGRDWELLEELGRYEAVRLFVDDVMEIGILDKAREEAEIIVGEFVSSLLEKPVDVVFDSESESADFGATCQLEPPFGWSQSDDGAWQRN